MSILVLTIILLISFVLGNYIFRKWFNPISLYSLVWYVNLALYELRLMNYTPLTSFSWFVIAVAYISFVFGASIVFFAHNLNPAVKPLNIADSGFMILFREKEKVIKSIIIVTGLIGLFDTIWHWYILISKYGSIAGVILNANEIYNLRVEGKLGGIIPYLLAVPFVGVFYSGIYLARLRKISLVPLLPLLAVIFKDIANFGRANMLFAFFLFVSSFILSRYLFNREGGKIKFKTKLKFTFGIVLISVILIGGAGLVRSSRGAFESFNASTRSLNQYKGSFFITPSLYLYLSSHVGILSRYLENDFDSDNSLFGETTFQPVYNFLSKLDFVKHPEFYDSGYFTPMWSNTGTYLRNMNEDFGIMGLVFAPLILGMLSTQFWFRLLGTLNPVHLVIAAYLNVIILFSFIMIYSRAASFLISFVISLLIAFMLNRRLQH